MTEWTIKKLLEWTSDHFAKKKIEAPRLSAELILSHALNLPRIQLYTNFDKSPSQNQLENLRQLVKRAAENEPVQYLVGKTEFYSIEIQVSKDCLIPRPETELLVERAIEILRKRQGPQYICDLCTGSGCIAIAIAKNYPNCHIIATDISDSALAIAAKNIEKHNLQNKITLLCGNIFDPIIEKLDNTTFDIIISNPPYVSDSEYNSLEPNVKNFEPPSALKAGIEGLDIYKKIIAAAPDHLKPNAQLMIEIGYSQALSVTQLLNHAQFFKSIKVEKDFQNNDRLIIASPTPMQNEQPLLEQ